MSDIIALYNSEDADDFANYIKSLMEKGKLEIDVCFKSIDDVTDLTELTKYKVLVFIFSPCMQEYFDDESQIKRFQDCLQHHPCIVCLQYYVKDDEISQIQSALSVPKEWKLFNKLGTKDECTEVIGSIIEILEEQRKPRVKPVPMKRQLRKSRRAVRLFPNRVYRANELVAVVLQKAPAGTLQIAFQGTDIIVDTKLFNETTFTFHVPSLPKSGDIRLTVLCNNEKIGECILRVVTPNLAAYECLNLLAQVLGVDPSDRTALDAKLVNLFDKSIPVDGTLSEIMKLPSQDMPFTERSDRLPHIQTVIESDQEIPTLLHFSAKHGLEELTITIMDTPGSSTAFQIENKDGHDPADLAELNGYEELAEHMRTHFETNTMVEYIHLAMDNIYSNQDDLQQEKEAGKDKRRSHSLKITPTPPEVPPDIKSITLPRRPPPRIPSEEEEKFSGMKPEEFMGIKSSPIIKPAPTIGSTTHDELLEIGNAVKTGEFTIEEAERLYASWIDRNKAAQSKSLRERKEAIDDLRKQYQTVFKPEKQKQRESVFAKLKHKVAPKKKSTAEPIYNIQITHPHQKHHTPARESTISNISNISNLSSSSCSSDASRHSNASNDSWRDSSRGSLHDDSESENDEDDDSPIYHVQRRSSDSKENPNFRVSMRDVYLKKIEEEKSPALPPPRPQRVDRPYLPFPTQQNQSLQSGPIYSRKLLPPPTPTRPSYKPSEQLSSPTYSRPPLKPPENNSSSTYKRPPLELPKPPTSSTPDLTEHDKVSPISKRPPAPIPATTDPTRPSYRKPPKPPKKQIP